MKNFKNFKKIQNFKKKSQNFHKISKMFQIMKFYQKLCKCPRSKIGQMSSEEQQQQEDRTVHVDQPCGW